MIIFDIKDADSVRIEDNIIFINCGFRSSNMITIDVIEYISEVFQTEEEHEKTKATEHLRKAVGIDINNEYRIRTSFEKVDSPAAAANSNTIYIIHTKLQEALLEWHRDKYNINKPRPPKVQ